MSRYTEFCEALAAGKARAEVAQMQHEDEEHALPRAVGEVVRRMCDFFQCPAEQVRYIDPQAQLGTGTLHSSVPLLRYHPEKGRHYLDVEIGLPDQPGPETYAVWLHLECVPLQGGRLEFHFGPEHFRLPGEEAAFFEHVAETINRELSTEFTPGPRKIG